MFASPLRKGVGQTVQKRQEPVQRKLNFGSSADHMAVMRHASYQNMSEGEARSCLGRLSGRHYVIITNFSDQSKFTLLAGAWFRRYLVFNHYKIVSSEFWVKEGGSIHFQDSEGEERKLKTLKAFEDVCKGDGFSPLTAALLLDKIPQRGGWVKWVVALGVVGIAAGVIYVYREKLLPQKQVVGDSTDHLLATPDEMKIPEPVVEPSLTDRAKSLYNRLASSTWGK